MRIKTIWTIPGMAITERLRRTRDTFFMNVAYHMGSRLRFWATIHNINHVASKTGSVVGSITVDELMKNMPAPKDVD